MYFHYFSLSCLQCSWSALLSGQSLEPKAWQTSGWHQQIGTQFRSCNYRYLWQFQIVIYIAVEILLPHTKLKKKGTWKVSSSIVHSTPLLTKPVFLDRLFSSSMGFWWFLHYFFQVFGVHNKIVLYLVWNTKEKHHINNYR